MTRGMFPGAIIIGAQRSGTTTLYNWLMQHPQIWSSGEPLREIGFFCNQENYDKGPSWYCSKFRPEKGQIAIEKSPTYLDHLSAPKRIRLAQFPTKFIVMLRNPTDRAYSHFYKARAKGFEPCPNFVRAIAKSKKALLHEKNTKHDLWTTGYWLSAHHVRCYIRRGLYAQHLREWFKLFNRSRFLILRSEDVFTDHKAIWDEVCRFLGIKVYGGAPLLHHFQNLHYDPIPNKTRRWLDQQFKDANKDLAALLGDEKWLWGDQ